MRHATPVSVLILAVSAIGAAAEEVVSADQVDVRATGALVKAKVKKHQQSVPVPYPGAVDVPNTPFVMDPPNLQDESLAQAPKSNVPVANTPFEFDPSFNPFEVDDGKSAPASDLQAQASVENDSPFALENEMPAERPEYASPGSSPFVTEAETAPKTPAAPRVKDDGPFVMEDQASPKNAIDKDEDAEDAQLTQTAKKKAGPGEFKIVRTGVGQPGQREATTSFVMNMHMEDSVERTTDQPTTSMGLRFELGDSLLETKGKINEPARADTKLHTERSFARIMRHDPHSSPPADHGLKTQMMMNEESSKGVSLDDPPPNVTNAKTDPNGTAAQEEAKNSVAVAAPPLHSTNPLNTPGTRPSVQLPPSDSNPEPSNSTMSAAGAAANSTLPVVSSRDNTSVSGTGENMTGVPVHSRNKRVSAAGAFISITLGLVITIFFLSIVLCVLNAGRKEQLDQDENKEPQHPRPAAPSYRQMMIAQQHPEASHSAASPPTA